MAHSIDQGGLPGSAHLNLIGNSPAFDVVLKLIRRMAACDATVLITGETGTGKELAARAIHYLGLRKDAPFIPVNCGALPETLVESELFGHARGAFTDAREARTGVVAQAEGGTLFLDEVEAMGPHAQVALLRFLQEREYRPIGGALVRGANVRVIASANVDLDAVAAQRVFRRDLLFRLNVLPLHLPPLRERGEDVTLLAQMFLRRFSRQYRLPPKTLDADSVVFLSQHRWPGNVRELENLIHRHFLLSDLPVIRLAPQSARAVAAEATFREAKAHAIAEFERHYLAALLARTRGNISLAARLSGKERSRLCKLVKKYGLDRKHFLVSDPLAGTI
jgi:DNA-binding NtrC family response regulator